MEKLKISSKEMRPKPGLTVMLEYRKYAILFSCVLLFTISVNKAFAQFTQNQTFPDGLSIVCKYDFVDTSSWSRPLGKKYNHVTSHNGKYILYANYRCGVVDAAGNIVIPEEYLHITRNGDVFEVRKKNQHGLIDSKGIMIGEYEYLQKMSDQLYQVKKNEKFGIIDLRGNEIIPCSYAYIGNISANKTIRVGNGKDQFAIMNHQGKIIIPFGYDIIVEDFDFYRICKDNKWGGIDSVGKLIIPLEYDHMGGFENDVSKAMKNDYIGYIDKNNRQIIDFKYVYINPFENGVAEACEYEKFVQADNKAMVKRYEEEGYVLLKTPTRLMVMCKKTRYSQLTSESLKR